MIVQYLRNFLISNFHHGLLTKFFEKFQKCPSFKKGINAKIIADV